MQNFSLSLCRCKKDFLKWEYFNVLVALLPVNRGSGAIPAQHLIRSLPNDPREAVLYFNRGNTISTINNNINNWMSGWSSSGFKHSRNCPATLGVRWFPFTNLNISMDELGSALGELIPVKSRFKEGKPQPPPL